MRQLDAQRLALVQLAATILGEALITRQSRQSFTVHELAGGLFHVSEEAGRMTCSTCNPSDTDPDRHAALVLLYVLALEGGRLP
ncbi:MAG TPA: hypothetical protein VM286_08675 [Candidatus Thermoplasmatota archaeon]|nr:hypothetical protein [Candidatus Thermoplasmatota archaeon]